MKQKIAEKVIAKYLKKGNMARCLRDILPSAGLTKDQRKDISELVHDVVRWKKLYEHIMEQNGRTPTPEGYVMLALEGVQAKASAYPFEYRYSCSSYVAAVLKDYPNWAEYLNQSPPTTLCVNLNKSTTTEVLQQLQEEKTFSEQSLLQTAIRTTSVSKYSSVIQQRHAHVQDENSQLVSALTSSLGESILDYCAGNGGKSLAIASFSRNTKKLSCYEINAAKRETLKKRCSEYQAHVTVEEKLSDTIYDVVLVDAPCSGLGAARRNPEAKYIQGLGDLPALQLSILNQASQHVNKNGYLFYVVCTFTTEETTQLIQTFTKNSDFKTTFVENLPFAEYLQHHKKGFFTSIPQGDIFFCSLLKR